MFGGIQAGILFFVVKRPIPSGRDCPKAAKLHCRIGIVLLSLSAIAALNSKAAYLSASQPLDSFVHRYCADCHDGASKKGGLDLETISRTGVHEHSEEWERVIRKLRARQMPPIGKDRPSDRTYNEVVAGVSSELDRFAVTHPNPGRTETFRRLNRTEYQNAIRDLLALDIDATTLLPKDDVSQGFDNVSMANLSPSLLNRYITAAEKISRLAIGSPGHKRRAATPSASGLTSRRRSMSRGCRLAHAAARHCLTLFRGTANMKSRFA